MTEDGVVWGGGTGRTFLPGGSRSSGLIATDVEPQMKNVNASLYLRIPFTVSDVNALVNLAICRWRLGEKKAALQDLELVLAIDPDRSSAQALRNCSLSSISAWASAGNAVRISGTAEAAKSLSLVASS